MQLIQRHPVAYVADVAYVAFCGALLLFCYSAGVMSCCTLVVACLHFFCIERASYGCFVFCFALLLLLLCWIREAWHGFYV